MSQDDVTGACVCVCVRVSRSPDPACPNRSRRPSRRFLDLQTCPAHRRSSAPVRRTSHTMRNLIPPSLADTDIGPHDELTGLRPSQRVDRDVALINRWRLEKKAR